MKEFLKKAFWELDFKLSKLMLDPDPNVLDFEYGTYQIQIRVQVGLEGRIRTDNSDPQCLGLAISDKKNYSAKD